MTQGDPNKKGYVYILVNPAFSGFLKIGKTAKEPEARARELSSGSGVPAPYSVAWDAFVSDCDQVERLIHQQLAHVRSRSDREFFAIPLKNAISVVSSIVASFSCEPNTPPAEVPAPADIVGSPVESNVTAMTDSPVDLRMIPSLEAAGYSRAEISDLQSAIASFARSVLPLKKEREAEAEEILRRSKGKYTDEILKEVFDKVDKGPVGPITGPWFGETLSTHNRHNVYALCRRSEANLNTLIDKLRETGDLGCLGEWRQAGNRGMKTGVAAHQQITHEWWDRQRPLFECYISEVVVDEIRAGDDEVAQRRMEAVGGLTVLGVATRAEALTRVIMGSGAIPVQAVRDAAHLAITAVNDIDYLLTWNCRHLANGQIIRAVSAICAARGFRMPVVCTPEELMGV